MDKLKALFGKSDKPPAPAPLPDRAPNVSPEQRQVPSNPNYIPERVLIHTTLGDITVGLFREQTPKVNQTQKPSHPRQKQKSRIPPLPRY